VCDKNGDGNIDRAEFMNVLSDSTACPEVVKILKLYEGGALKQWNQLGQLIEVNGKKPTEDEYKYTAEAITTPASPAATSGGADKAASPAPGCAQQ
jgi:hypothetical protein